MTGWQGKGGKNTKVRESKHCGDAGFKNGKKRLHLKRTIKSSLWVKTMSYVWLSLPLSWKARQFMLWYEWWKLNNNFVNKNVTVFACSYLIYVYLRCTLEIILLNKASDWIRLLSVLRSTLDSGILFSFPSKWNKDFDHKNERCTKAPIIRLSADWFILCFTASKTPCCFGSVTIVGDLTLLSRPARDSHHDPSPSSAL